MTAMPHDDPPDALPLFSERDKLTEQVITALKYLGDECRRTGLTEFGEIVEDALERCLKRYVDDQREALAKSLSDDTPTGGTSIN